MQTTWARRMRRACFFLTIWVALVALFALSRKAAKAAPELHLIAEKPSLSSFETTVVAAGDISDCTKRAGSEATAHLIDRIPGTVLALGDLAYPDGSEANFRCYDKTWGRHKSRTRPAPGNHEYHTPGAAGYFAYFGDTAGKPGHGYYSFNLGPWHLIALDSQCAEVGGCQEGSPEERWLREDLRQTSAACILAFQHVPRFSSGDEHGDAPAMTAFWKDLYAEGADVVLAGHDHDYERFAPQTPDGIGDPERGIREFVVGTGGKSQRGFRSPSTNSEVRSNKTFGVLRLTLHADSYDWKFIPVAGGKFTDFGSGQCHGKPGR